MTDIVGEAIFLGAVSTVVIVCFTALIAVFFSAIDNGASDE